MANANVKLGVEYSEFKRGMKESQEAVKSLTEALKLNDEQMKLNGNEEEYLANKADLLKKQIAAQTEVVRNAEAALKALADGGTEKNSVAYRKMEQQVTRASTELTKMRNELKQVESGTAAAEKETSDMNRQLEQIGHGVDWDNVTNGIHSIVTKLESGARAAVNFGKKMLRYVSNSAEWADELLTMSKQTGYSVEELQRMENVAEIVDTSTDAIITAKSRMKKAVADKDLSSVEEVLGIKLDAGKDPDELFWDVGEAILAMGNAYEQESAAQAIFGRNWRELVPLFMTGREAYEEMLSEQRVLSDEDVGKLGEVSDELVKVNNEIERMKNQFIADNADKILGLLEWFTKNFRDIVTGIAAIGAALTALKLGEFYLDLKKTIDAFGKLGLFGGGKNTTTTSTPTDTGTPVVGTGENGSNGGGGGALQGILNTLVLLNAANAVYQATEAKIKETQAEMEASLEGLEGQDLADAILMHDLGITHADLERMNQSGTLEGGGTYTGRSFGYSSFDQRVWDMVGSLTGQNDTGTN
ncbi:MAG: hypothetical protein J6Y95_06170, partial [Lachnospiraceae bacterium]|nr:hypothetical protein [Lachnospiraceae bacterium]